jgi:pilus assembly protein Flp/PilA
LVSADICASSRPHERHDKFPRLAIPSGGLPQTFIKFDWLRYLILTTEVFRPCHAALCDQINLAAIADR